MRAALESYFQFKELGTNWRTEALAGCTTFVTMAYIIFVNPSILREAGMPPEAVTAATCLASAIGCFLMGGLARYPIALAPGMGLNAYFTYTVCQGLGVPWQTALGAVFLSGLIFLVLIAAGIRQMILESIPRELYSAVAVGIGLFIALIGMRNAGIITASPATMVTLGNLRDPKTLLALGGLLLICALLVRGVRAAMLIGILATTAAGAAFGFFDWTPQAYSPRALAGTWMQLDVRGALHLGLLEIIFVFLFVDVFDNVGTLVAVGTRAGLIDAHGRIPRVNRILASAATASSVGAVCGTSTVVSYIESAAGVVAGGRSGVTAIVCGLLFLAALVVAPLFGAIPAQATAPALIVVGALMLVHTEEIEWTNPAASIPAFLTLAAIPMTFSIANGLAFGFTAHTLLKVLSGQWRRVHWMVYLLTALFLLRFFYLGEG
ncbi:MAG: NCS2 family permease [Bryobacteraceae bacterium]|nr:NCS2 family permease [Bryobacteraceae bacterium]MCX7604271.1 NCS2 family permease [Bryobacteraceae bacterium]